MSNRTAGHRYARALFDVAIKEKADLAEIERQLASFSELFVQHPALSKVLLNPAVPVTRKRDAVSALAARGAVLPLLSKLLVLLAERDRLVVLPDLVASFRERMLDHQKIVRAEITTAAPLSADRAQAIEKSLARVTGRSVTLSTKVDASLLGGVVARLGSTVYDASLAGHLRKLRQQLSDSL